MFRQNQTVCIYKQAIVCLVATLWKSAFTSCSTSSYHVNYELVMPSLWINATLIHKYRCDTNWSRGVSKWLNLKANSLHTLLTHFRFPYAYSCMEIQDRVYFSCTRRSNFRLIPPLIYLAINTLVSPWSPLFGSVYPQICLHESQPYLQVFFNAMPVYL